MKGDFDNDGRIGIADFVKFAACYGSKKGDAKYSPLGDFNDDGKINIFDFVLFAKNYGKTIHKWTDPPYDSVGWSALRANGSRNESKGLSQAMRWQSRPHHYRLCTDRVDAAAQRAAMLAKLSDPNTKYYFTDAHGSGTIAWDEWVANKPHNEVLWAYKSQGGNESIEHAMANRPPITLAVLWHCHAIGSTGSSGWVKVLTKGKTAGTCVVGFCALEFAPEPIRSYAFAIISNFLKYLDTKRDLSFKQAFDLACKIYPDAVPYVKFAGDASDTFKPNWDNAIQKPKVSDIAITSIASDTADVELMLDGLGGADGVVSCARIRKPNVQATYTNSNWKTSPQKLTFTLNLLPGCKYKVMLYAYNSLGYGKIGYAFPGISFSTKG